MRRPSESTSSVAAAFATSNGLRYGEHDDLREQLQPRRRGRRERERDEGIERVMSAGRDPARRRQRVIGDGDGVEAGGLRGARHRGDRVGRDELRAGVDVIGGELHGEAHGDRLQRGCGGAW